MSHITSSGRTSTDPYFDARSLRADYHHWHDLAVDMEDREPLPNCALAVSYRAHVRYTDAGDVHVHRVEVLLYRTTAEDKRRGRPLKAQGLSTFDAVQNGLIALLMADARGEAGMREILSEIEADQQRRDDELAYGGE